MNCNCCTIHVGKRGRRGVPICYDGQRFGGWGELGEHLGVDPMTAKNRYRRGHCFKVSKDEMKRLTDQRRRENARRPARVLPDLSVPINRFLTMPRCGVIRTNEVTR